MIISNEEKERLVNKFMSGYNKDKNSAFRSYDYAYKAFADNRGNKENVDVLDYVALNLFAYLGSWGMVCRGNVLMLKDYKFLIPVVKLLYKYDYLCDMDPLNDDFDKAKYIGGILEVIPKIKKHFNDTTYYKYETEPEPKNGATDTVIGKILMATLGCIPAYDEYVCYGMGKEKIAQVISEKSINGLLQYCFDNKETLINISNTIESETKLRYSAMKILDMIFWEYGLENKYNKANKE